MKSRTMARKVTNKLCLLFLSTALILCQLSTPIFCELDGFACPEQCDCHFFRVNWLTDCSHSNLTSIPLDQLSLDVYTLNVNWNKLSILGQFPEHIKLRRLQASHNHLKTLRREDFRGLAHLLDADLSWNQIETVDPDAFIDSPGLITLELQNNPLKAVDGPFIISRSLMYLHLSNGKLTHLADDFFQNSTALNKLDLSGNPITSLVSKTFDHLTSLEELKLNRCNLTQISEDAFQNLTNLKTLELSDNVLTGVKWTEVLGSLALLEHLELKHSAVSHLPEDAFFYNSWLRNLILADNELSDLYVATALGHNLKHLEKLDLSNCNLRGSLSADAFSNATRLRTLVLNGNPLSAVDLAVALQPLTRLQKLSLRNCSLTRISGNNFNHLQELDVSHNPLRDAFTGLLVPLDKLEHLDMSYSNITHLARNTFSSMNNLKRLILSGNPLIDFESEQFQNLIHLEALELNYCGLTRPPDATVFFNNRTYTNLQEISLRGNPLEVDNRPLLPMQLSRLRSVDLSDCNLTTLPESSFIFTYNITSLILSRNRLGEHDRDYTFNFLNHLPNLVSLDISDNLIKYLNPDLFEQNPSLTSVTLTGNPWECGCYLTEIWEWASNTMGSVNALVGSTTQSEDIATGSVMSTRSLTCSKERSETPEMSQDQNAKLPWAKYIKESDCKVSAAFLNGSFETYPDLSEFRSGIENYRNFHLNRSPPAWLVAIAALAVFLFMGTIISAALVLLLRRAKLHRLEAQERKRLEENKKMNDDTTRIELASYLERRRQFDD